MTQCGAAGIRALWMAVYIAAVFEEERRHREKHGYWTNHPKEKSEGAGFIPPGGHVPDWVYRATLEHLEEHRIRMGLPSDATEEDRRPYAVIARTKRMAAYRHGHQRCERCAGRREGSSRCQGCERFICDLCRGWLGPDRRRWLCADCVGVDARSAAAVS